MIILQTDSNPFISMLPLLGMVVVFYFLFMRPQQKKAKAQREFNTKLDKGSVVVTGSGIIGRISKIEDEVVTLQLADKTFIKVLRSSVSKEMTEVLEKSEHGLSL
ncbi:preprotein translocase subunit YajC [Membranicola marinus]|uniref:Sec translocon accessory complex subunit YajC n=1 Tax=Membranihabitans marinus TaxID=1227546 RepID=A0A953LBX1_9BACT|nr:preprotein translocase subunit YajC [Membranihabitans marinus]MBY5957134.1 preprotein translocase subunit YajC [Membranihabitans marinus]